MRRASGGARARGMSLNFPRVRMSRIFWACIIAFTLLVAVGRVGRVISRETDNTPPQTPTRDAVEGFYIRYEQLTIAQFKAWPPENKLSYAKAALVMGKAMGYQCPPSFDAETLARFMLMVIGNPETKAVDVTTDLIKALCNR